jgi:hypothetical protein
MWKTCQKHSPFDLVGGEGDACKRFGLAHFLNGYSFLMISPNLLDIWAMFFLILSRCETLHFFIVIRTCSAQTQTRLGCLRKSPEVVQIPCRYDWAASAVNANRFDGSGNFAPRPRSNSAAKRMRVSDGEQSPFDLTRDYPPLTAPPP